MKTEELDEVFSGIPELIDFHSLFLHLVQEKLAFFDDEQTIGDAFITLVSFFVLNLFSKYFRRKNTFLTSAE